jgi:protein-S-isoprenylcysteine O-methyltransferase Ste14
VKDRKMNPFMRRENLAPLIFVLSALGVLGIGWLTRSSLPISRELGRALGGAIFLLGMGAFAWIVAHLREAFLGEVAPVTEHLIKNGPYHWVRHPLYLSMIIVLLGIAFAFRSLWGVVSVFVLFLPAVVHRAKLEDIALSQKFGSVWEDYASNTAFLIPWLW